jgi:hypothetical protein
VHWKTTEVGSTAFAATLVLALACRSQGPFACIEHGQCVDGDRMGTCQPNGYCSFDDPTCPSGQRYGAHAGRGLAGTCVGDGDEDTGEDTFAEGMSESGMVSGGSNEATGHATTTVDTTGCPSNTWHRDADGDGFGDPDEIESACEPPTGYVADGTDCDDTDPRVNPAHLGCPNPTSLVGWWRFDGRGMAVFGDDSDYGNDGSPIGGPTNTVMGPYREALRLDGSTQAVDVSNVTSDLAPTGAPTDAGTLEAWVRSDGPNEPCQPPANCAELIVHVGPSDPDPHPLPIDGLGPHPEAHLHLLFDYDDETWSWNMYVGDDDANCRPSSAAAGLHVALGQWTHVAGTWSEGTCRLYVDGTLVDEIPLEATPPGLWDAAIIGTVIDHNRRWLHGAIDEVMLFTEARTEEEIRADCGAPQCTR